MPAAKTPKSKPAPAATPEPAAPRPPVEIRRAADLLKQVSDPTRLQVLMLLSEKERDVTGLCAELGAQSQPAVSHHLSLLRHGRLVEPRREGKHNYYGLTDAGAKMVKVVSAIAPEGVR